DLAGALRRLAPALGGAVLAPAAVLVFDRGAEPAALAGVALAVWAMLGVLADLADRTGFTRLPWATGWRRLRHLPRASWGQALAHFGVGVLIAGITVSTAWRIERVETMHPGDTVTIAGRSLRLVGVSKGSAANYQFERADIVVGRPGGAPFTLHPERRFFPLAQSTTARTAIATNGVADLYLALGDPDGRGGWVVRAYYNPLVPWIWFGAVLAVLGGVACLGDRLRYGRARAGAAAAAMARSAGPG